MFVSSRFKLAQRSENTLLVRIASSTNLVHYNGRLNPLPGPAIGATEPLLDIRPKERHDVKVMGGTVERISTAVHCSIERVVTHLPAKAEKISSKVFVRLYSANISSIGTSGVGWFFDPSSNGLCTSSRSVRKSGICVSTKSETISSRLLASHRQRYYIAQEQVTDPNIGSEYALSSLFVRDSSESLSNKNGKARLTSVWWLNTS
jgi:hypothetical protein